MYFHTSCRLDTHLSIRENTEIGNSLLVLQSLFQIISVSTQRSLASNIQTHAAHGYAVNKPQKSQDKLPVMKCMGDWSICSDKVVLWSTK